MRKRFSLLFLLMPFSLLAQVELAKAKGYLNSGEFDKAIPALLEYLKAAPQDEEAMKSLAFAYAENGNFLEASQSLARLMQVAPDDSLLKFDLAKSFLRARNFPEARKLFHALNDAAPGATRWKLWIRLCDSLSLGATLFTTKPEIALLSLNGSGNESGALAYPQGRLIYASHGQAGCGLYASDMETGGLDRAFYAPHLLAKPVAGQSDCWPAVQREQGIVWFTRVANTSDTLPALLQGQGSGIYSAKPEQGEWKGLFTFPFNSSAYNIRHAAPAADGSYVIFASDMPGGLGGYDLYVSYFMGGWQKPENLGPEVNSAGNEITPALSEDGSQLFFASDGRQGLGKLDLFMISRNGKGWMNLTPLPYPLNSKFNDFGYSPESGGKSGFFHSDRPGGYGKDDIFMYMFPDRSDTCAAQQKQSVCLLLEEQGMAGNEDANTLLEWNTGDGFRLKGNGVKHCFEGPGYYDIELIVTETVAGMPVETRIPKRIAAGPENAAWIQCPDKGALAKEVRFDGGLSQLRGAEVMAWSWDFGDGTRAQGRRVSHVYSRPGIYEVKLSVSGVKHDLSRLQRTCALKSIIISGR